MKQSITNLLLSIRIQSVHLSYIRHCRSACFLPVIILAMLFIKPLTSFSVPSYARQTRMACNTCHTAFPQLTAFGRSFKLNGYNLTAVQTIESKNAKGKDLLKLLTLSPLSAMFQGSLTFLQEKEPDTKNGNVEFPQQLSLFYAGAIAPGLGTFIQLTYDDQSGTIGMDNTDIRYSRHASLGSKDLIYGLTLNNSPTVEDIWNTTPAWGYPFAGSGVAPAPAAATMIDGGLAQEVAGLGAYGFFNNLLYGEFSVYRSAQIGAPNPPDTSSTMLIKGVTPYWRVALQHQFSKHYVEIGTYGLSTMIYPAGMTGPTDRYLDLAVDLQYEYAMTRSTWVLRSTMISERQTLDATFQGGGSANRSDMLSTFRINGSLYLQKGFAFTLGYFMTNGDKDAGLYGPDPIDGSMNHSPNSNGLMAQIDLIPWQNTQFSLQYILYDKFNGGNSNYDGSGRHAGDNNTIYILAWINF
jgi:hypothetical protein